MLSPSWSYVRRHHVALLALFAALGGTGAYAATQLRSGEVRGFNTTANNSSGVANESVANLHGLKLKLRSQREEDARQCALTAKVSGPGQLHTSYVVQPNAAPREFVVRGKDFATAGSQQLVSASFDAGAPGITRQVEGQLTWHSDSPNRVVTSVFHMSATAGRCLVQGTLTGAR